MTAADYAKARRVLARRDPVIRDLMRRHGECGPGQGAAHRSAFRALLHAIIAQQLSTKAAATIEAASPRCSMAVPRLRRSRRRPTIGLRAVGHQPSEALGYIRDLCARTLDGSLALDALRRALPDEDVIDALTSVKGIGRWTARRCS